MTSQVQLADNYGCASALCCGEEREDPRTGHDDQARVPFFFQVIWVTLDARYDYHHHHHPSFSHNEAFRKSGCSLSASTSWGNSSAIGQCEWRNPFPFIFGITSFSVFKPFL